MSQMSHQRDVRWHQWTHEAGSSRLVVNPVRAPV